jgi:DNA-binding GntR family transcriptional regulator
MKVVCQLTSQISPCEWNRGYLLGNEMELAERLNIDRSVVRQAIRIMEDAETATAVEGRGHGLITRTPGIGHLPSTVRFFLFRVTSFRSMPKRYSRHSRLNLPDLPRAAPPQRTWQHWDQCSVELRD